MKAMDEVVAELKDTIDNMRTVHASEFNLSDEDRKRIVFTRIEDFPAFGWDDEKSIVERSIVPPQLSKEIDVAICTKGPGVRGFRMAMLSDWYVQVLKGTLTVVSNAGTYDIEAGMVLFLPKGTYYYSENRGTVDCDYISVHIPIETVLVEE